MNIRIAAAAVCTAIGMAAAGLAIAQGAWPQLTKADLESCRNVIVDAHSLEITQFARNTTKYCKAGGPDYRADLCQFYRDKRDRSGDEEDLAWYIKGNARCEDGEYPCFGGAVLNDQRTGQATMTQMASSDSIITDGMDFWDASHKADNCAAAVWVRKLNGGGPTPVTTSNKQVKPAATGPITANDPTFQSNIKTFDDNQLLALVKQLLETGNIDVAKLARNALLQRFPDSSLVPVVAQLITTATNNAAAAPPPPLAVRSVNSQRVFLNDEAAVIQAFAKVGFVITQSASNPKELRHDKNYFTVWIGDCEQLPCKALQIRGQYTPVPMPPPARIDEWNAGKLYGRGALSGAYVIYDMTVPIPSKGIDLDDLKESIDRFVTQSDYFYTAITKR